VAHVPLQIVIDCDGVTDPSVIDAPLDVLVRIRSVSPAQVQQLRRVLHDLVRTTSRTVRIDLADVDELMAANVFAVVVGAARKAKTSGATVSVCCPPASLRRAFAVAGLADADPDHTAGHAYVFGTVTDDTAVAV
jgi:anti-anti-sigma regulatory factor